MSGLAMSAQPEPRTGCRRGALPKPGPPTLRVLPIPRTDPPAVSRTDQEPPSRGRPRQVQDDYVQGTLAVDFRREHDDTYFGPQATGSFDLPEPGQWTRRMVTVVLEVLDGLRPANQLTRWVAPEIHQRLARRGLLARQRHQRQRHVSSVRAMTLCRPADGIAELSVVVVHHGRVRALAVRLSGIDGRWLITALEIG